MVTRYNPKPMGSIVKSYKGEICIERMQILLSEIPTPDDESIHFIDKAEDINCQSFCGPVFVPGEG